MILDISRDKELSSLKEDAEIYFSLKAKISIDLISPQEPRAI